MDAGRRKVLFKSGRTSHNRKFNTLFTVGPDGGFPQELAIPMAEFADLSPDGRFVAYNPIYQFWQPNWRRYRGGTAPPVWIVNLADYSSKEIPRRTRTTCIRLGRRAVYSFPTETG
jgi:tricorn protease